MFDAEDVATVLVAVDAEILDKLEKLLTTLEDAEMAEDGEMEDADEIEDLFEDMTSAEQKALEKGIRQGVAGIKKAAERVLAQIKEIDDVVLEDDEDDEDEGDEDEGDE